MKDSPRETCIAGVVLVLRNNLEEDPTQEIKEDQTFLVLLRFREGTKLSIPPLEGGHSAREFLDCDTKNSNLESYMFNTYTCTETQSGKESVNYWLKWVPHLQQSLELQH